MRTFVVAGISLAIAATLAPIAAAQVPTQDSVSGSGIVTFHGPGLEGLTTAFDISIRSGPTGEQPTGSLQLVVPFTDPSCVVIRDGGGEEPPSATINLLNTLTGLRVVIQISGGAAGPQFIAAFFASSPTDCAFRTEPSTNVAEVISGHIDIVDAPPLPTSTQECKNGGWRAFGFKNQGDCVSFVATGGQNPPGGG
jgi:hypothetical protein